MKVCEAVIAVRRASKFPQNSILAFGLAANPSCQIIYVFLVNICSAIVQTLKTLKEKHRLTIVS